MRDKRELLAEYLRVQLAPRVAGSTPELRAKRQALAAVPLTQAQRQVWLLSQFAPGLPVHNEPFTIHRNGQLDVTVLNRALTEVIRRHAIWRTRFPMLEGEPVQVAEPAQEFTLPMVDLGGLPERAKAAEALRLATEDARKPFDLAQSAPIRGKVVRLGDEQFQIFLTLHQIIYDGVSIYNVFLPELAALYEAYSKGLPSPLPEPSLQYADFAVQEQESLRTNSFASHMAFWTRQLSGDVPVVALPFDRPRPPLQTFRGALHKFAFPPKLAFALKEFCRTREVSLFTGLLATFYALLFRYSGQEDVVIGTVSGGRRQSESNKLMGLFINPVVLRGHVIPEMTVCDLLQDVRSVSLDALSHGDVPFAYLVRELQPQRDPSRNPWFQVMITLQPSLPRVPGWTVTPLDVGSGTSTLDLHFLLDARPEGMIGRVTYNPDLFDDATISRMVDHWQQLIAGVLNNPQQRISELPLLTAAERRQVLVEWNATATEYEREVCLPELFESQVERTPTSRAVISAREQVTFQELNKRANQLAHLLRELSIKRGDLVGVCLERSIDMVASLLAVLKAGAAYVPLDPKYPRERLAFILEDSGVRLVVTTSTQSRALPKKAARLIYLDQEQSRIAQCSGENLPNENVANDPVYVIYTSGSTGKPKGVVAPHKGAVNRFTWMWKKYPFDQDEVCAQKTSCNFVDSVWEIFGPLLRGIPTFILDDEVVKDPRRLVQDLAVHRVSRIVLVPSHLRFLLDEYEIAGPKLNRPKLWVASGEVLTAELAKRFQETMVGCTILNLYGSSEVAADVTWYEISESTPINLHVPIGYPISNTQVYILDRYVQPVPVGVVGEICVAGDNLANEYLKRSELTATRFTVNPFSTDGRGRLFRTGDLGRWLPNGSIQYIGRSDFQVKIRGIRIELEEIEVQLMKHPDVKSAAVTTINSRPGEGRLVAYVTSDTARRANPDQLRNFLRRTLPDPMIPYQFIVLEALPLLPNGKVNRRALPVFEPTFSGRSHAVVLPRNEQERKLAEIWEAILGISPVGVHQNFFDLGGHSLLAARMVASIDKILGKKLSLGDVFRASTVAEMSSMLNRESSNQKFDGIIPIQPHGPKPPLFWVRGGALFLPLARRLSPEQPVLGLHLPSTEARRLSPGSTLEEIAGAFVRKMRAVQPEGPYCLAGLCVNGILAYEMARQLRARGQQVALLAMFDSQNPVCHGDYSRDGHYQIVIQRVLFHLRKLAHLRHGGLGSYIQDRLHGVRRRWHGVRWQLAYDRGWNKGENLQDLDHIVHPAAAAYCPRPYAGNICFFQSTDWPTGQYWNWHLGWIPVAVGGLNVQTIEGEHESIFHEVNVERLVTKLRRCLQESQNDGAQGSLGVLFDPEVSMATLENAQC